MARLRVQVRFYANDVWVLPELIGRVLTVNRGAVVARVALPRQPSDFQPSDAATEVEPTPACFIAQTFQDPTGPDLAAAIRLFSVTVEYDADVPPSQPDPAPDSFFDQVKEQAERGVAIANEVAHDFLRWLRVSTKQEWLGLSEDPPEQYGRAGVFNADTGSPLMGLGPEIRVTLRSTKLALTGERWTFIEAQMQAASYPAVTDSLLADARHMLLGTDAPDAQRSVLVAAMACEIKAERTVKDLVSDGQRQLMNLVLRRVSNAADVLDAPLAALGRPTLKADAPALYKDLRALNELRNRIVHAGVAVTADDARRHLWTADQLFLWLDEIPRRDVSAPRISAN